MSDKLHLPHDDGAAEAEHKADLRTLHLAALCHEAQVECLYWKMFADAARSGKGKVASGKGLKQLRAELQQTLEDARALTARVERTQRELAHLRRAGEDVASVPAPSRRKPVSRNKAHDHEDLKFDQDEAAGGDVEAKSVRKARRHKRSPKVSIIIAVSGSGDIARLAIEPALVQSYSDTEVIVVADGAADGFADKLAALEKTSSKLTLIDHDGHDASAAVNCGLAVADGDYVLLQGAHDVLEVDALANLAAVALAHNADVVGGALRQRLADKDVIVSAYEENAYGIDFRHKRQKAFQYATLYDSSNKLFSREFLDRNGLKLVSASALYDIELWLRSLFLLGSFCQIDKLVSTRNMHLQPVAHLRTAREFEAALRLVDNLIDFYDDKGLRKFSPIRNQALLGGVLSFNVRWKLDEFDGENAGADLVRLTAALRRVPEADFATFYIRKSKGPMAAVMLLTRQGQYLPAKMIMQQTDPIEHTRLMAANPRPAPHDLVDHALGLIGWEIAPA